MGKLGKYFIGYLINGNAKSYHNKLANDIANKFKIFKISDQVDPHITFKGFTILLNKLQLQELEVLLKKFCNKNNKTKIKLKGIGHFDNKVIFIEVEPSKEMKLLYAEFVKELENLRWVPWNQYDKENIHFHATLAEKFEEDKFERIYKFASKEKPDFDLELDNICILKKPKDKWILYKKFKLN